MEQTDLEWLRDYCLAAIIYRDQNTSVNERDREDDRENYDRASELFEQVIAEDRLQR
jgi:hypothetical protein